MIRTAKRTLATMNIFFLRCLGSAFLKIRASVLTTANLIQQAKTSPVVFKASMVIGMPIMQTMMVRPCPSRVLGVIFPNPNKRKPCCIKYITL